jgi:uncharacterized protein
MIKSPLFLTVVAIVVLVAGAMASQFVVRGSTSWTASAASVSASPLGQVVPIQPNTGSQSGIVVTGQGRVTVKPDIAQVTLGVEVTNVSASAAQQAAASQMDAVVSQLKQQGIEDKDIQTVQYNLTPEYDYSNNRTPTFKDYRVSNLVAVTVRDITKVGAVLDAVSGAGATRIQGISFSVSDPTAATTQGRDEAMKNARAKADQLAKDAGVTLGAPISIQETGGTPPPPVTIMPSAAAPAAAPVQTPISPGTQEVQVSVTVVYGIR